MQRPKLTGTCLVLLVMLMSFLCTACNKASPYSEDKCLRLIILKYLQDDSALEQRKIVIFADVDDRGVTLKIDNNRSPRPFPDNTIEAIREGKSLQVIKQSIDNSVDILILTESNVKKLVDTKSVKWEAEKPLPPGSQSGTSYGPLGNDWQEPCAKYRK